MRRGDGGSSALLLHLGLLLFTDCVDGTTPPGPETKQKIIMFTFVFISIW